MKVRTILGFRKGATEREERQNRILAGEVTTLVGERRVHLTTIGDRALCGYRSLLGGEGATPKLGLPACKTCDRLSGGRMQAILSQNLTAFRQRWADYQQSLRGLPPESMESDREAGKV